MVPRTAETSSEETLKHAETEHGELFRFDTIRTLVDLHENRKLNIGYHLWGLLTLFLWMKRWGVQSAKSPSTRELAIAET